MDKKKKKKNLAFSLLLAVGMLLPSHLPAQEQNGRPGGLFGESAPTASDGLMRRNECTAGGYFTGQGFGATNGNITGQTFGDNAPLGGGLFVLLAAGAGYSTIKSRKKHQNRKEK
jgi:hypothetical protein